VIARYLVIRQRIQAELEDLRRAAAKAQQAFQLSHRAGADATFYLDSTAMNLHGVYSGIERIFEGIARELDGGLPPGPIWHRALLEQMTLEIEGVRPAVIRRQTAAALDEYLRFRHLVRNLYTRNLEAERLSELVLRLPERLALLDEDLRHFGDFLRAASTVDNT
jgi:hypothetical protein